MDFLAHILWSIIIFGRFTPVPDLVQIGFFSVLPDIIWGLPAIAYYAYRLLLRKKIIYGEHGLPKPSALMQSIYNFGHSFAVMIMFFGVLSLIFSRIYYPLLFGWGLHLLIDILIHKDSMFKQRPLYPLTNRTVRGYIWHGNKKFVIVNWLLIIILTFLLYVFRVV